MVVLASNQPLFYATQVSATPSTQTIGAHEAQEPLQDTGEQS
jgi:hypothetical protein